MRKRPKDSAVELPKALSKPSGSIGDYTVLLYGEKKIGKTTLASQFPNALFMMCEPGGKGLSIFQLPVRDWKTFRGTILSLKKDTKYDTVIVDTVDVAYQLCFEAVCQRMAIEHPSDEDWGKGWQAIRDEWNDVISELLALDKGVILISHAQDVKIERRSGGSYHKTMPTVSRQARDLLEAVVDLWLYYEHGTDGRTIWLDGDELVSAGCRPKGRFLDSNGNKLKAISAGSTCEEAYRRLCLAFKNQADDFATGSKPGKSKASTATKTRTKKKVRVRRS